MTLGQNNKTVAEESLSTTETDLQSVRTAVREKRLTRRQALFLPTIPLTATIGNTLLSAGMRQVGPIPIDRWWIVFQAIGNAKVIAGVLLLIGFFSAYLLALSWADLTFVIPTTSLGYVLVPLVSRFYLKEQVSWTRWGGIALICLGVAFVAGGPSRTSKPGADGGSA